MVADNLKYFADTFGKENIVAAHLHRDEETPHIHVTLVPSSRESASAGNERNRRRAIPQEADRHRKAVRRRYHDTAELKSYQDTYAEAMAKSGCKGA